MRTLRWIVRHPGLSAYLVLYGRRQRKAAKTWLTHPRGSSKLPETEGQDSSLKRKAE